MKKKEIKSFYANEAAKLAGLTLAMVNYLCRTGLVVPTIPNSPGRGRRRKYSFGDVVVLRVIARLLRNGISVKRLKGALTALRKRHPEITASSLPGSLLFSDGRNVYFREGREVVEDLNKGQFVFAFVVELSNIQREIATRSRHLKRAANVA